MSAPAKEIDPEIWKRNLRNTAATDDSACLRWLNNYFAFWFVCEAGACKRNKRCAGDPEACHDRMWPHVPERMKFEFRAAIKARTDGLSPDAAMRKVKEDLARFDEITRCQEGLEMSGAGGPRTPLSPRPAKRGEGGREQSERPGEGHLNYSKKPSPALAPRGHPLPQAGEGKERKATAPRPARRSSPSRPGSSAAA